MTTEERNDLSPFDACLAARKLARKIGDEEWKKGNTKYALEAYEAAGINPVELLNFAQNLLTAEGLTIEWTDAFRAAQQLPRGKEGTHTNAPNCPQDSCKKCIRCRTIEELWNAYSSRIRETLGWSKNTFLDMNSAPLRAAAVACLKLIKRLSVDWPDIYKKGLESAVEHS